MVLCVMAVMLILVAEFIPTCTCGRKYGNEASAIGALKTVMQSEALQHERSGYYVSLPPLAEAQLVDPLIGSGTKLGYTFQASPSRQDPLHLWFAVANPTVPGTTGDRYFATNQAGVIFYTTAAKLELDTASCSLPNNGLIPTGK